MPLRIAIEHINNCIYWTKVKFKIKFIKLCPIISVPWVTSNHMFLARSSAANLQTQEESLAWDCPDFVVCSSTIPRVIHGLLQCLMCIVFMGLTRCFPSQTEWVLALFLYLLFCIDMYSFFHPFAVWLCIWYYQEELLKAEVEGWENETLVLQVWRL